MPNGYQPRTDDCDLHGRTFRHVHRHPVNRAALGGIRVAPVASWAGDAEQRGVVRGCQPDVM
jgi:hypothetical protein